MTEMKIFSNVTNKILSTIMKKAIKKKTGIDVDIDLKDWKLNIENGRASTHLVLDAEMDEDDILNIIKELGII